jgi:hypothetical protein
MYASVKTRVMAAVAAATLTGGIAAATAAVAGATTGPHGHPHPRPSTSAPARVEATKLTISNKRIAHARHHSRAITGVLTADRKGVAAETVVLMARSGVMPRWHAVAAQVTSSAGVVTFTVAPKAKTQYHLVFLGDTKFLGSQSNVITLH